MNDADTVIGLVAKVEKALAIAVDLTKNKKLGVTLQKIDLELKVASKKSATIGGKIEFGVSIDASAEKEWSRAHSLIISLIPKNKIAFGKDVETEELANTIVAVATAMGKIATSGAGDFTASEGTASIDIEESKDGKIQVVAGGGGTWTNSHTIKLTFLPS